jgi:hypothetical protein|tara:strand:+ start:661 stop:873 length:213 start_codon:yes stop_codon:yes gene_type:complete
MTGRRINLEEFLEGVVAAVSAAAIAAGAGITMLSDDPKVGAYLFLGGFLGLAADAGYSAIRSRVERNRYE